MPKYIGLVVAAACLWMVGLRSGSCDPPQEPASMPAVVTPAIMDRAHANYLLSKEINQAIVSRGATNLKRVALTFDDGPHPGKTEPLLACLTKLNVHATFFVIGKMAVKAPYLLQEEIMQGSEVGNHTYNHIHVTSLDDAAIAGEIFSTNDVVRKFTGEPAVLFRPPGGRISWGAYRALRACGMVTVLWTDDPEDYLNPGKPNPAFQQVLLKRLLKHIRPGGIILLHDGILDTVAILPEFIHDLRAQGYEVGTVTELLLAQQHHEMEPEAESMGAGVRPALRSVGPVRPARNRKSRVSGPRSGAVPRA